MNVSIRELRSRLSSLLRMVESGEEVVVTKHGRPLARFVAIDDRREPTDSLTVLRSLPWLRGGIGKRIAIPDAVTRIMDGEQSVSEILVEERG